MLGNPLEKTVLCGEWRSYDDVTYENPDYVYSTYSCLPSNYLTPGHGISYGSHKSREGKQILSSIYCNVNDNITTTEVAKINFERVQQEKKEVKLPRGHH